MRILVTGATGTLGRALVPVLLKAGHQVRALSRTKRESSGEVEWVWGDLVSGSGLAEAVRDAEVIAHLATGGRRGRGAVDVTGTRRLVAAAREGGGYPHLIYTSVVGANRLATGHLRHKLEAERLVSESELGWTVLRATVFHQWLERRLNGFESLPVLAVDRTVPWQPVHAREVAERLTGLIDAGPARDEIEYGGPQVLDTEDLVRTWLRARNLRRPCLPVRYPGGLYAAQRAGELLTEATPTGEITWRDYLFPIVELSDDFGSEHTTSPTSPANQPEHDPDLRVYGGDEGYERPTRS